MDTCIPKYLNAKDQGRLLETVRQSARILASCTLCPRQCGADRTREEMGVCSTGKKAVVASFSPHFGEEPQLVGVNGSGTLFFSHCNLKCIFCQNYEISVQGQGQAATAGQIASIMLYLQRRNCHNINLVTPSHVVPQILEAVEIAAAGGLTIPLVYNCSGYESLETLELLKDVIDIYLPDFKFWEPGISEMCCQAKDYPQIARKAIGKMYEQVGDLKVDKNGIACSGLLVRHLVLPENRAGTYEILKFLRENISSQTHVNIMSQYRPMGEAARITSLSRPVTPEEVRKARQMARDIGLNIVR
ncbi:MAG: radical SAM protein [Proteobacteria bacterium]|nr:radical SAM protein [Pseudomonadota bacterium]